MNSCEHFRFLYKGLKSSAEMPGDHPGSMGGYEDSGGLSLGNDGSSLGGLGTLLSGPAAPGTDSSFSISKS